MQRERTAYFFSHCGDNVIPDLHRKCILKKKKRWFTSRKNYNCCILYMHHIIFCKISWKLNLHNFKKAKSKCTFHHIILSYKSIVKKMQFTLISLFEINVTFIFFLICNKKHTFLPFTSNYKELQLMYFFCMKDFLHAIKSKQKTTLKI